MASDHKVFIIHVSESGNGIAKVQMLLNAGAKIIDTHLDQENYVIFVLVDES